jgi:intracellular sulfur oxidation DsrE/DsrF family protein
MVEFFSSNTPRRGFLGRVAAAAAMTGVSGILPKSLMGETLPSSVTDAQLEAWFKRLTGKHRIVFDGSMPNDGFPAIWPRVYLNTMEATYPGEGASAMVILRHEGLPLSMQDSLWAKYKLGEMFKVNDGAVPATRNVYASITSLPLPGLGITELMKAGVLVGACDVALTVYSSMAAQKMKMDAAAVKKEWVAGLLPGVQVVPSGVFAVARAQEYECKYCFAG